MDNVYLFIEEFDFFVVVVDCRLIDDFVNLNIVDCNKNVLLELSYKIVLYEDIFIFLFEIDID